MAVMTVINLRLPESLNEKLNSTSGKSGAPKNKIFNDAVTAAVKDDLDGHCEKPKHVHTCVRLPIGTHNAVKSMANRKFLSINAMMVEMLANHLGVEPCVVEDVER